MLRNFVVLADGVPARMHFAAHALVDKPITDPLTRFPKTVRALELLVDQLNGQAVSAAFSVTAEKLAVQLQPWVENGRLSLVDFVITKRGTGFATSYSVEVAQRQA